MFRDLGFTHILLLALLVPVLFVIRRRLPRRFVQQVAADLASGARSRRRRALALELTEVALAAVFFLVGGAKLIGRADMLTLFHAIGFGEWFRYLTGAIEVGGAALMVVPIASGASAIVLGALMIAATFVELLVLHRPPIAAAACLSAHSYVAWARLTHARQTFVSIRPRGPRRSRRRHSPRGSLVVTDIVGRQDSPMVVSTDEGSRPCQRCGLSLS
jgi:putative oxidoreductase